MSKRSLTILALLTGLALCARAQAPQRPFVGSQTLQELQTASEMRHPVGPGNPPQLTPQAPLRERILREASALEPSIGVEVLLLLPGIRSSLDAEDDRLKLYNLLRSVSSLKGIEYYSASRRRMRTLFVESYAIDDPVKRQRLPDPLVSKIPAADVIYILQEDLTFGKNVYRSDYLYEAAQGVLALRNENLTPMRYLGMTMIKPGQSLTWIVLIPYEGGLLFYGLACARTAGLLGLEKTREDSFYNRLKAIYGWCSRAIEELF